MCLSGDFALEEIDGVERVLQLVPAVYVEQGMMTSEERSSAEQEELNRMADGKGGRLEMPGLFASVWLHVRR